RSVFSPEAGNWPDFRDLAAAGRADGDRPSGRSGSPSGRSGSPSGGSVPDASYMAAWCHGAPGIGLARLALLQLLDDPAIHQEVQTALRTTLRQGFGSLTPRREGNHSLCHGDLGNVELLLEAGRVLGEPRWQQEANRVAAAVLESIERDGWLCGNRLTVESPGLMTGLAGIGYGLLRCAEPDRVPSVLSLTLPGGG
ncbi:MAG: hypothetical protein JOZ41_20855, partial [Chloroflexi bacterium]|nr:hypothetical protein [Chloroflexota bacterium]